MCCCHVTSPLLQQAYGCKSLLSNHTAPIRKRNLAAVTFDPTPTQQSLPFDNVVHPLGVGLRSYARLLPLSDGACPTVHRSTAKSSLANPRRSTSPRPLPVYQRATVHWRSCVLRRPYACPPPLADGACSTVHHSTSNSGISNPDCCMLHRRRLSINEELYVIGVPVL